MLSQDSIISKTSKLVGREIQIVGRTCEVAKEVSSESYPTNNLLFEHLAFSFNRTIEVRETCHTREGNTTKSWSFSNTMNITLPLSCSIQSELINCGSVQIQSEKNRTIQLDHHRMVVITRDNEMEKHAKLNRTDYIKSPGSIEEISTSVWSYQWNGASTKTWVIRLASTVAALAVLVVTVRFISRHSKDTKSSLSINIDNNINNVE